MLTSTAIAARILEFFCVHSNFPHDEMSLQSLEHPILANIEFILLLKYILYVGNLIQFAWIYLFPSKLIHFTFVQRRKYKIYSAICHHFVLDRNLRVLITCNNTTVCLAVIEYLFMDLCTPLTSMSHYHKTDHLEYVNI